MCFNFANGSVEDDSGLAIRGVRVQYCRRLHFAATGMCAEGLRPLLLGHAGHRTPAMGVDLARAPRQAGITWTGDHPHQPSASPVGCEPRVLDIENCASVPLAVMLSEMV